MQVVRKSPCGTLTELTVVEGGCALLEEAGNCGWVPWMVRLRDDLGRWPPTRAVSPLWNGEGERYEVRYAV